MNVCRITLCLSCYLESVLSLTQLSVTQWSSTEMVDRSESPREGDVPAPALCQQLVIFHLFLHLRGNPELMLRGCPAQGQTWDHRLCEALKKISINSKTIRDSFTVTWN